MLKSNFKRPGSRRLLEKPTDGNPRVGLRFFARREDLERLLDKAFRSKARPRTRYIV